jgi:hypothetical protein
MKKLIGAMVLAVGLLVSPGAWAVDAPRTVEQMLSACEQEDGPVLHAYCSGALDAVASALQTGVEGYGKMCPPEGVTSQQLTKIFTNWAKANPKLWHEDAFGHMASVAVDTWPCPTN